MFDALHMNELIKKYIDLLTKEKMDISANIARLELGNHNDLIRARNKRSKSDTLNKVLSVTGQHFWKNLIDAIDYLPINKKVLLTSCVNNDRKKIEELVSLRKIYYNNSADCVEFSIAANKRHIDELKDKIKVIEKDIMHINRVPVGQTWQTAGNVAPFMGQFTADFLVEASKMNELSDDDTDKSANWEEYLKGELNDVRNSEKMISVLHK